MRMLDVAHSPLMPTLWDFALVLLGLVGVVAVTTAIVLAVVRMLGGTRPGPLEPLPLPF
ncbi:hypothetical protein SAMN05421505_11765 [Sinosporangium album]|uniref:Uncharacterized protein n=1 Tax=Sinosporangium album TaxID=504805 RepID=A0A1G8D1R1_9ACTN|nr:hypothetical protein [Sinosporangium album]SDH51738.1 hypothetical protein SAMN05421505_11765 [Sinosporangium album]